jgi:hypothetical protein
MLSFGSVRSGSTFDAVLLGHAHIGRRSLLSTADSGSSASRGISPPTLLVSDGGDGRVELHVHRASALTGKTYGVVLACFSVANPASYDAIPALLGDDRAPRILVACQCDLRDAANRNVISARDGVRMMAAIGARAYIETSSTKGINVFLPFDKCGTIAKLSIDLPEIHLARNAGPIDLLTVPEDRIFCEFCRLMGPALRKTVPGAPEVQIVSALAAMFRRAPPEMKMEIKKSLLPAKFFRRQPETLIRYQPGPAAE